MSDNLKPYRAKEAAEAARVNVKTIYEAVARGDIAAFRVGKVLRFPTSIRCAVA